MRPLRARPREQARDRVAAMLQALAAPNLSPEERDRLAAELLVEIGHGWDYEERLDERWPE